MAITTTSVPTTAQVLTWIEESEDRIGTRNLGTSNVSNQLVDVQAALITPASQYNWNYSISSGELNFGVNSMEGIVIPLVDVKVPVIAVSKLEVNTAEPDAAANWTTLTEGPGLNSSFMILRTGNLSLGYAIWFYNNEPEPGIGRIRLTYTAGSNIDSGIIGEYCTYDVAIKVLIAKMGTNDPAGLTMLDGQGLNRFIPTQYQQRIAELRNMMIGIEVDHFPRDPRMAAVTAEFV